MDLFEVCRLSLYHSVLWWGEVELTACQNTLPGETLKEWANFWLDPEAGFGLERLVH